VGRVYRQRCCSCRWAVDVVPLACCACHWHFAQRGGSNDCFVQRRRLEGYGQVVSRRVSPGPIVVTGLLWLRLRFDFCGALGSLVGS
jgi:hypothetical protein